MTTTTGSMLALAPGTFPVPGPGANTDPPVFLPGTHHPGWLATAPVPLFISDRRLRDYKTLPRAARPWALDSGAFTELSRHSSWDHGPTPRQYIARVRRHRDEIGNLAWAAPQDRMCEPFILVKTGHSVGQQQRLTVDNVVRLRSLDPDCEIIPVLQGWRASDYLRCADLYDRAGIDLTAEPLVGLGSVCRRQATGQVELLIYSLHARGITRLHGFGVKTRGLGRLLTSADSMAWSYAARRQPPLPGCDTRHVDCANCPRYAYRWHARLRASLTRQPCVQLPLFDFYGGDGP